MIKHIRIWNIWRKRSGNGLLYKFIVLLGLVESPTMKTILLPEEIEEMHQSMIHAMNNTKPIDLKMLKNTEEKEND